ncbi:MAG: sensor histidine kinase [Micromonosporaceae bacterium]
MRVTLSLVWGTVSTGPAGATLSSVAVRTASAIRLIAVAYVIVGVGIWHSHYAAAPWRLAGPAAAVGWAVVLVVVLARSRAVKWLVLADSGVLIALAFSGAWWVPPQMRGDTASWLYILLAAQSVFPLWCARLALAAPLVLASGAAYCVGVVYLSPVLAANSAPTVSTMFYFAVAVVAWVGYHLLNRRAVWADTALAEADAAEHEQYIALCRHAERREHERLLHDTVLNTLTALSRMGNDPREVIDRCEHDVALMEGVLGGPEQMSPEQMSPEQAHVLASIEAAAAEMRARGLCVHVRTADTAQPDGHWSVPVPVAAAVIRAVREALTNVARHAGTGEAWVEATLCSNELTVTVRDHGTGFDPGLIGPDRLGIGRSIVERIADCGGAATVASMHGKGTTVTLRVPARAQTRTSAWVT